jgi:hypothetical protein
MSWLEITACIWVAGFVIGLGAVTVIETLGFLGQRSGYWTEATIRAHKVTKPLIWLGLMIATLGGTGYYSLVGVSTLTIVHAVLLVVMVVNGSFLTFWVSPRLLLREQQGKSREILPKAWKTAITLSFFISILTWWPAMVMAIIVFMD